MRQAKAVTQRISQIETGFLDSNTIEIDADGNFEIILSAKEQSGNWLRMDTESESLLIRQTFLDRALETPAEVQIIVSIGQRLPTH